MDYIAKYGLEVMIAVSRFWSQRVSFSQPKQKYVILGVTGPDEYETMWTTTGTLTIPVYSASR